MQRIFINPSLDAQFYRKGFIVIKLFDEEWSDKIAAKHKSLHPDIRDNFYATQNSLNYDYRRAVEDFLFPLFSEKVKALFCNHEVLYTQFMVKQPGANGACDMHQDWTFVKEPAHFSMNLWCALQDVNETNGCLWMLPGSQHLNNYHRGRNIERSTLYQNEFIRKFLMEPVILKKGEAVLFHARMVHESRNNDSISERLAAATIVVPKEGERIHYLRLDANDNEVIEMEVDGSFYVDHSCQIMPQNYSQGKKIWSPQKYFSKLELLSAWLKFKLDIS